MQSSNAALFRFNPTSNVWTQYRAGQQSPWSKPATYTAGSHAVAINRDLSALTHDLARLTAEWESVTAAVTAS